MLADLQSLPAGLAETSRLIALLDDLWRAGFAGGRQHAALSSFGRVFADTPLDALLAECLPPIGRGEFQERHFVALAAARAALQGAQYDVLRRQARAALGRSLDADAAPSMPRSLAPDPLLESTRHWLMELAIAGFARLDASAVLPFLTTLARLRQQPRFARLAFLLTGFTDELLASVPIANADELPLARWCDLWSTAMLDAVGAADLPAPQPATGIIYPLGIELRESAKLVSIVVYGVLTREGGAELVRLTRSRFKVDAIGGSEVWLLFPDVEPLLGCLAQGKALEIHDMPLLPTGDVLWAATKAQPGEKYRPLEIAARYFAPQSPDAALVRPLPPLDRHPIQLAEPIALTGYTPQPDMLQLNDGASLPLDARWRADADLPREAIDGSASLFGLLRYDAGRWAIQPLAAATRAGKLTFAGQGGAQIFKKPPKNNSVAILEERASRLLRKS